MKTVTIKLVFRGDGETWKEAFKAMFKSGSDSMHGLEAEMEKFGVDFAEGDAEAGKVDEALDDKTHIDISCMNGESKVEVA